MADGVCDLAETPHGRNWMLTRLSPPVTLELCDDHCVPGIVALLAGQLGADYDALYQNLERFMARQAKQAASDLADAQAAEAAEGSQAADGQAMTLTVTDGPGGIAAGHVLQEQADAEGEHG